MVATGLILLLPYPLPLVMLIAPNPVIVAGSPAPLRCDVMTCTMHKIPFYPVAFLIKTALQNGGISPKKIHILLLYLIRYLLLEPFRLLEIHIYQKKITAHKIKQPPIFILGHWRSGTSHLQHILQLDPEISTSTIFRSIFADNYYLTESWLKRALNFLCSTLKIRYSIQRTTMDMDLPAELDLALCAICSKHSYSWGHILPKSFATRVDRQILFEDDQIADSWLEDYDYMIRKLSYRSGGRRVLVKSPGDTARISHIRRKYPEAKFIFIHRDPVSVYHSSEYLWETIQRHLSLHEIQKTEIQDLILNTYQRLLSRYLKQRNEIPNEQLVEISHRDLQQDPLGEIRKIYSKFELGTPPEEELAHFLAATESYKHTHYSTPPELKAKLAARWSFAFEEWPA